MLNVGDKLQGRYEIKEIRMGGLRVVYIAHDYLSEKLVMIETLRDKYLDHKDLIESFLEHACLETISTRIHWANDYRLESVEKSS